MKQYFEWSKPYHGVTHLIVHGIQHTVSKYDGFAEAVVFPRVGTPNFFSSAERKDFFRDEHTDFVGAAKAWCESMVDDEEENRNDY